MMKHLYTWSVKYNTGNFVIDHQHKQLLLLINNLREVCQQVEFQPTLLNIIFEEVTNYTQYHFKTEEEMMNSVNYSGIEAHKELHRDFVEKLVQFKIHAKSGTAYIDLAFCQFLKDWLIGHIAVEDPKIIQEMSTGQGAV